MTAGRTFRLNGRDVALRDDDAPESLLRWLRRARLTGTKEGCADGDCGACTVAFVERADDGSGARFRAVNSCLVPMGQMPGRDVVTVEALADGATLHPVQQALVDAGGSQCGYCTPGFVMSLFAGFYAGELDDGTIEGNLCRCTGYVPIRHATQALAARTREHDRFDDALAHARAATGTALGTFHNPATLDEALALKGRHPEAAWIAGATDLGVELSHGREPAPAYIALDRIAALRTLRVDADAVHAGAGVPLTVLERELAGVFPSLDSMLHAFAARQVRNRATLGGNLGTASPIGDLLPVLLALDAQVHLASTRGERTLALDDAYFTGYRRTARAGDELVTGVTIPRRAHVRDASYKVAKRQADDISIVAGAFALGRDDAGRVAHARLAYGGVAAVPRRAQRTEAFLAGRTLDAETVAQARALLAAEFEPLSDHRASAGYRRALAGNLFAKFVAEHCA